MTSSTGPGSPPRSVRGGVESGAVNAAIEHMSVEKTDKEPACDTTPLAPGVWVTEAPGFACVPPRTESDLRNIADQIGHDTADERPASKDGDTKPSRDDVEPRIERYRER